MNVQAQVSALINEMRGVLMVRNIHSKQFEQASDSLETLVRVCTEPLPKEISFRKLGFTRQESRIFGILHARLNRVVSRTDILHAMYFDGDGPQNERKNVDVHICKIRRKMRDGGLSFQIATEWGFGFKMSALEAVRA